MQRSTVHSTRQAQPLLPSDDDDDHGVKIKSPTLSSFYAQVSCKACLAAILFVCAAAFLYLNSEALNSQALNNRVTVMQSNNGGLISDQLMALQSDNNRLVQRLESAQQDQVLALQSQNERLRQRLESVKQSNVRRSKDKPGAVGSAVTPKRRSSIPVKVVGALVAAPVATTNKKAGVVSALKPLVCQEFIEETKSGMYRGKNFIDPNLEQSFIRQTTTERPFWISVHNKEFDTVSFGLFENGWYYEKVLAKIWTNILREASPGSRVLDVGYVALRYVSTTCVLCSTYYHVLLFCCVGDPRSGGIFPVLAL
jgi:hypothetical protein